MRYEDDELQAQVTHDAVLAELQGFALDTHGGYCHERGDVRVMIEGNLIMVTKFDETMHRGMSGTDDALWGCTFTGSTPVDVIVRTVELISASTR